MNYYEVIRIITLWKGGALMFGVSASLASGPCLVLDIVMIR